MKIRVLKDKFTMFKPTFMMLCSKMVTVPPTICRKYFKINDTFSHHFNNRSVCNEKLFKRNALFNNSTVWIQHKSHQNLKSTREREREKICEKSVEWGNSPEKCSSNKVGKKIDLFMIILNIVLRRKVCSTRHERFRCKL